MLDYIVEQKIRNLNLDTKLDKEHAVHGIKLLIRDEITDDHCKRFYYCKVCGNKFKTLNGVIRHIFKNHIADVKIIATEYFNKLKKSEPKSLIPYCKKHDEFMTLGRYSTAKQFDDAHKQDKDGNWYYCDQCVEEIEATLKEFKNRNKGYF